MIEYIPKHTTIISRDRKKRGRATGAQWKCRLDGCRGMRITTRWPDGKITHPCSEGLVADGLAWRIS